jgi:hypothetical protein
MAEEGFLRAFLPDVGGVELLFLTSFSSCSFEMTDGFSRDFLPAVLGPNVPMLWYDCFEHFRASASSTSSENQAA